MAMGCSGPDLHVSWIQVAHTPSASMASTTKSSFHPVPSCCVLLAHGKDGTPGPVKGVLLFPAGSDGDDDECDDDDLLFRVFAPLRLIVSILIERRKALAPRLFF